MARPKSPPATELDLVKQLAREAFEKSKSQEQFIEYLRKMNYVFLDYYYFKYLCKKNKIKVRLKTQDRRGKIIRPHKNYQFLVRLTHLDKLPKEDTHALDVAFAVKIVGVKTKGIGVYYRGKFVEKLIIPWNNDGKEVNLKAKRKFYEFPKKMSHDDRALWRLEHKKRLANPELPKSELYSTWENQVALF